MRINKKEMINYISNSSLEIKNKKIRLNELLQESHLNIDELIFNIKQKICLLCNGEIINNNIFNEVITLPCKCKLCSKKCVDDFFKNVENLNEKKLCNEECVYIPFSFCFCGYKYKYNDFIDIINKMENFGYNAYIKIFREALEMNLNYTCFICRENFNKEQTFFEIVIKNDKNEERSHLLCQTCHLKNKIHINNRLDGKAEFNCEFCQEKHFVQSWKRADKKITGCIIF